MPTPADPQTVTVIARRSYQDRWNDAYQGFSFWENSFYRYANSTTEETYSYEDIDLGVQFEYAGLLPGPHDYFVINLITAYTEASLAWVWEGLKRFSYPGQTAQSPIAATGNQPFVLPFGRITQSVDELNLTITNVTIAGQHILHPGSVTRRVVIYDDKIFILTTGTGSGLMPEANTNFAPTVWGDLDSSVGHWFQDRLNGREPNGLPW